MKKLTNRAAMWQHQYDEIKSLIIADIWSRVKDRPDKTLEVMETRGIPALVTQEIDYQTLEVINELVIDKGKVIALAGIYEDDTEYKLEEFEVPFLIAILNSVEKHIALEDKKK